MTAGRFEQRPAIVLGLVGLAVALAALNFSVVFVAFDSMIDSFGASRQALSWALTAFSITVGALTIPAGWLVDRLGRKTILLAGLGVFVVGSAAVSLAPTVPLLVVGRVIQAAGLSMESIAGLAMLLDAFGPERRSSAVGALGAVGGLAAALGPTIGGLLLDSIGWRWTFFLDVPIGLVLIVIIYLALSDSHESVDRAPPDLVGIAGLIIGASAVALAAVQSNAWGFGSARFLVVGLIGVVSVAAVVVRSRHHAQPILFLPLYRDANFRWGSLLTLVVAGSFGGLYLAWVEMLVETWGLSLSRAGLALSLLPLIAGPLSFVAGSLADRFGHRVVIVPGSIFMAASAIFMLWRATEESALLAVWVPFAILYGIGVGLAHSACHAAAMVSVPAERLGIGGAMSRIGQDFGSTVSVALVIALAVAADDPVDAIRRSAIVLLVVSAVGVVAAAKLRPVHHGDHAVT